MLIRTSGPVFPGIYLLTLGTSVHYGVGDQDHFTLFDPGPSLHVPYLLKRLERFNISAKSIRKVCLTHTHFERASGITLLRRFCPQVEVIASPHIKQALEQEEAQRQLYDEEQRMRAEPSNLQAADEIGWDEFRSHLQVDTIMSESDTIDLRNEVKARLLFAPGHTPSSVCYMLEPYDLLLVDEGFGYYRGSLLAAPGGDTDLQLACSSIKRFSQIEISGIGFPHQGLITGDLTRKHLQAVVQNTEDLISEVARAHQSEMTRSEIEASVLESFYRLERAASYSTLRAMERTFAAVMAQVLPPAQMP